ncbi:MAG: hypothetical protein A2015_02945 [Spirochaetes bacterium GWF1_31_7]|nr:MAG: hypothetical protein A2Y30_12325 [Spirochaetes bacterium GWE1_32_154]OHD46135.1 MAG: hypothetical protein A2Y29_07035 [Spirochaetes bacterium GWE2_31_10]OHD47534.1 MAG: hypothetical protein A2015_02945 [Spirochaetes bacterium GWF1_31_7]OHD83213.1 MAG: hypothetical protein A2355_12635 [Spirochaetes bacterium RIFOXYB1_FULL_32_8]
MKQHYLFLAVVLFLSLVYMSCKDYSGIYTGYSWQGEAQGVLLSDATQKIETTLTLDKKSKITDAKILFYVKNKKGEWKTRQDTNADVKIDYSITPTAATPQSGTNEYKKGASMFTIKTNDLMSFYSVGVSKDGVIAFAFVEPMTRYMFEMKFDSKFDFNKTIDSLTIGNGGIVPSTRTSGSGSLKPVQWSDLSDKNLFGFYRDSYIYTGRGTFKGLTPTSTIKEFLEKAGVSFVDGKSVAMEPVYGFYANGGWAGNYKAIEQFLTGKDARKYTSLIDWTNQKYAKGINKENFFGLDATSGATKTVQNSSDGISGATVRMSRESTSYQRALVNANIIKESEVVKGRF